MFSLSEVLFILRYICSRSEDDTIYFSTLVNTGTAVWSLVCFRRDSAVSFMSLSNAKRPEIGYYVCFGICLRYCFKFWLLYFQKSLCTKWCSMCLVWLFKLVLVSRPTFLEGVGGRRVVFNLGHVGVTDTSIYIARINSIKSRLTH